MTSTAVSESQNNSLIPNLSWVSLLLSPLFSPLPSLATPTLLESPTVQLPPLKIVQNLPTDEGTSPSLDPLPEVQPLPTLPSPNDLLGPEFSSPSAPALSLPDAEITVVIQQFEILGSTVFDSTDFDPITAEFLNRPISFRDVVTVRDQINQLYQQEGYVTSGAIIPPQSLAEGIARIQVVEGSVEDIVVEGTERLNSKYVRNRIARGSQTPLRLERLLERLQLLQLDPLIDSVSANLQAGTSPGTNLLVLSVVEADTFDAGYSFDNNRSPTVGSQRHRLQLNQRNLTGAGNRLSVGYALTEGSDSFDLNYTHPINADDGTLSLAASYTDSDVVEDPFDTLDISSESTVVELTLQQPIIQTPTEELALGLVGSYQSTQTSLGLADIGGFPLSAGADDEGRTTVTALRFFQEWTQRSPQQVVALRSQFNLGLDILDATSNPGSEPDSEFFSWLGQGQWVRLFAPDTPLVVRGSAQLSPDNLLGLERYTLGGQATVRGYQQDQLLTDNGVALSAELRFPLWRKRSTLLQITPFIDGGHGWNNDPNDDPGDNTLLGIGTGLLLQAGRLNARIDVGIPLIDVEDDRDSIQENGVYFSLNYSLF